jgi:hypothetical protein
VRYTARPIVSFVEKVGPDAFGWIVFLVPSDFGASRFSAYWRKTNKSYSQSKNGMPKKGHAKLP